MIYVVEVVNYNVMKQNKERIKAVWHFNRLFIVGTVEIVFNLLAHVPDEVTLPCTPVVAKLALKTLFTVYVPTCLVWSLFFANVLRWTRHPWPVVAKPTFKVSLLSLRLNHVTLANFNFKIPISKFQFHLTRGALPNYLISSSSGAISKPTGNSVYSSSQAFLGNSRNVRGDS